MKFINIIAFIILLGSSLTAQTIEKVVFNAKEPDSDYYLALAPEGEIKGALLLLPGFGQNAESIFPETKIQNVAYGRGLLTIALAGGQKLHCDDTVTERLNAAMSHVRERFGLKADQFVMGGFSAGGTISLRYTELAHEKPADYPIQPKAVFTVDSPVDLIDIWNYFQRELKKNFSEAGTGEARFVGDLMRKEIGTPEKDREKYLALSPFTAGLDEPGNERFLKEVAVRTYEEIDMDWLINQRMRSLYDHNGLNASELIISLRLLGNERAEYMTAKQPGVRSNGLKHPHSWSIVDEVELVSWVLECLNVQ